MTQAVPMASAMVEAAMTALKGHIARRPPGPTGLHFKEKNRATVIGNLKGRLAGDPFAAKDDQTEIGQGLVKYFSLRSSETNYWNYVEGILKTFLKIRTGLSHPYTVRVRILAEGERGRVMRSGTPTPFNVSPIREAFGFLHEWDHQPWLSYRIIGNIELSPKWVCSGKPDEVARTIVHEASHKFAYTNDVLYKHETFAKREEEWGSADVAKKAAAELARAKVSDIPGRTKPLVPMMGFEGGHPDPGEEPQVIGPERWLENADSYAWFARRMYKRAQP